MKYFTIKELTRSATARCLGIDNTPINLKKLKDIKANILKKINKNMKG